MGQPAPYEFRDANEIVNHLSSKKAALGKWFSRREPCLSEIVKASVGPNAFRAFRHMPRRPSMVFREWASKELHRRKTVREIMKLTTQRQFDEWLHTFTNKFFRAWREQMGEDIPFGPAKKLIDLLLKHFLWWSDLPELQRTRLMGYLYVPYEQSRAGLVCPPFILMFWRGTCDIAAGGAQVKSCV